MTAQNKTRAWLAAAAIALGACAHPVQPPAAAGPALLPSRWVAQSIAGKPVTGHGGLTLAFDTQGKIYGFGGCNRYTGQATIAGPSGLAVGPLTSTRVACVSARLNSQETAYLAMLGRASAYAIDRDGWLVLSNSKDRKPSRFAPDPAPP